LTVTGTVAAAVDDELAFLARLTNPCAEFEYARATESSDAIQRRVLTAREVLVVTSRSETRPERMGVGARKARSETRKAARRMRGEREWYRWFLVAGIRAIGEVEM